MIQIAWAVMGYVILMIFKPLLQVSLNTVSTLWDNSTADAIFLLMQAQES